MSAPTETKAVSTAAPSLARRILMAIPVVGHVIRAVEKDVDTILWLMPVFALFLAVGVYFVGIAFLTMVALVGVALMYAFFIAITYPSAGRR